MTRPTRKPPAAGNEGALVDRLLSGIAMAHADTLRFAIDHEFGQSTPTDVDLDAASAVAHFPYAAALIDASGMAVSYNAAFAGQILSYCGGRNVLGECHDVWAEAFARYFEFQADATGRFGENAGNGNGNGKTANGNNGNGTGGARTRFVVYLSPDDVAALFNSDGAGDVLTNGETATLIQMSRGLGAREIAKRDGTSYETRRTQIKTIQRKLGLGSGAQLVFEVNSRISSKLFSLLFENMKLTQATSFERVDLSLIAQHYGPAARIIQTAYPTCPSFTAFDIGPEGGRPVLVFHSILYPCFPLPHATETLYKMNLRMIVPARPGYAGTSDIPVQNAADRQRYLAALELFVADLGVANLGVGRLRVLSLIRGALWAREFLCATGHDIEHAVLASSYIPSSAFKQDNVHGRMAQAVLDLARKHPRSIRSILSIVASAVRSPDMLMDGAKRLYKNCPVDQLEFERVHKDPFLRDWLPKAGRFNIPGIAGDVLNSKETWHSDFTYDKAPVTMLSGDHDPVVPQHLLHEVASQNERVRVEILEDAAFLYYFTQPRRILDYLV